MAYFDQIKKYLLRHHFHFVTLLLFFCLNGYRNFRYLTDPVSFLPFFLITASCSLAVYFLLLLRIRNKEKAGLLAFYFLFIFLFFGNIEDAFAKMHWLVYLSEPRFFIPFLLIISSFIVYKICTTRKMLDLHIYLNLVVFLWVGYEIVLLNWPAYNQKKDSVIDWGIKGLNIENKIPVYWVVLDEYAGDSLLKSEYDYDNSLFKDQMRSMGFGDITNSKANYPLTVYSVASFLNMRYLPTSYIEKDYAYGYKYALAEIRHNRLVEIFSGWGYKVNNFSFFDFKSAPAYFSNSLWGGGIRAVTARCMHIRLYKHFVAFADKDHFGWFPDFERDRNYKHIIDVLKETSKIDLSEKPPSFNYLHFMVPHRPFLFDSVGGRLKISSDMKDQKDFNQKAYVWAVKTMNQLMAAWSRNILIKYKGNVVIMIMSDHGPVTKDRKGRSLDNLSLIYTPQRKYSDWYSGMSNVNQGRILLNQVFGQKLPLLRDSFYHFKTEDQLD